jgi:hypothetical protein
MNNVIKSLNRGEKGQQIFQQVTTFLLNPTEPSFFTQHLSGIYTGKISADIGIESCTSKTVY